MDYDTSKLKIKTLYDRDKITKKDYYRLVSQLRARFSTPRPEETMKAFKKDELTAEDIANNPHIIFDGGLF